jgi:DNA-binding transcriptional LysR family regulator
MDVRELRYFVAVAEELNFTRAALRLGIAQPPLSRAIRGLERSLGAELFERDSRGVRLTPAGTTLLAEAGHVLDAVSAATNRTRRAAAPTPALVATAKPGPATALLRRIAEAFDAPVSIVVSGYGDQAGLVRDGRADVALLGSPQERAQGLDTEPLLCERRVAALPASHPLARLDGLSLADLAGQPFPRWPTSPQEHAYWTAPHALDGPEVADIAQMLDVIGLGQAVALVPEPMALANPRPDVSYRTVADATPYVTAIAWPAGSRDRTLARFVETALRLRSA